METQTLITISRPRGRPRKLVPVVEPEEPVSDSSVSTAPPAERERKTNDSRIICDLIKTFLSKCETKTQRKETVFVKKVKIDSAQIKQICIKLRQVNNGNELFRLNKLQSELKHCRQYLDAGFTIIPAETDREKMKPFMNEFAKLSPEVVQNFHKANLFGILLGKFHCENLAFQFLEKDTRNALLQKCYTQLKIKRIERFILEHFNVLQKEDLNKIDELFSCRNEITKALNDYDGTKLKLPLEELIFSNCPLSYITSIEKKLSEYSKDADVSRKQWPSISDAASIIREGITDFINMHCFQFIKDYLRQFSKSYVSNCDDEFDDEKAENKADKIVWRSIVNCISTQVLIAANEVISQKLRNRDCDGFIGFPEENAILVRKFCDMPLTDADVETIQNAVAEKIGFKYQFFQSKLNSTYLGDKTYDDDDEELTAEDSMSEDDEDDTDILYREQKIEVEKKYVFLREGLVVIETKEELACISTATDTWQKVKTFRIHNLEEIKKHFETVNDAIFLGKRFDIRRWFEDEKKFEVKKLISLPNKPFGPVMLIEGDSSTFVFNVCPEISYPPVEGEVYNPDVDGNLIKPILEYIEDLVGGDGDAVKNSNYLINSLAYKIQKPNLKMNVALILQGKQGDGKDTFCDLVIGGIWKQQYRISTDAKRELFEKHANIYAGSTIIKLEEMNFMATSEDYQTFKSRITCSEMDINPKNKDIFTIPSYHWFIGTCNGMMPVKLEPNDRRFVIFSSKGQLQKGADGSFWINKRKQLSDPTILSAFARYLRARDISSFDPKLDRPETEIYAFNKIAQRNPMYGYFENIVNMYMIPKEEKKEIPKALETGVYSLSATSFYTEVMNHLSRTGYQKDATMTVTKFGRLIQTLFPSDIVDKSKTSKIFYKIDIEKVEKYLRENGLWNGFERA